MNNNPNHSVLSHGCRDNSICEVLHVGETGVLVYCTLQIYTQLPCWLNVFLGCAGCGTTQLIVNKYHDHCVPVTLQGVGVQVTPSPANPANLLQPGMH